MYFYKFSPSVFQILVNNVLYKSTKCSWVSLVFGLTWNELKKLPASQNEKPKLNDMRKCTGSPIQTKYYKTFKNLKYQLNIKYLCFSFSKALCRDSFFHTYFWDKLAVHKRVFRASNVRIKRPLFWPTGIDAKKLILFNLLLSLWMMLKTIFKYKINLNNSLKKD